MDQTFGEKTSRERPFAEFTLSAAHGLRVTLLERGPGCHPERSAGSLRPARQTLRRAQGDRPSLHVHEWMVRSGGLAQVLFERIACGSTTRGDLDFPIDRLQVGVDRARTDDELCGDLGVGQSLSQQAQHLHFAHRQPIRIGGWRFRWWSRCSLYKDRHWSSSCKGLLPCHATSLGPCNRKGSLTQLGMCGSDGALIVGTVDGWQGRAEGVAHGCCCGPQPHCPCRLTLRRDHDGQTLQSGSNTHDGQTSQQALFIHRACGCVIALNAADLSEKGTRPG